jgi:hypothetical protein
MDAVSGTITTLSATTGTITTGKITTLQLGASQEQQITVDGTGYLFRTSGTALPGNVAIAAQSARLLAIKNSTGHAFATNTTGTTHRWISTTSKQPT